MTTLSGLNAEQLEAVRTIEGPLLVLAGPGSGKTRVIVHRVANLIHEGVPPWQILAVTFTNKAAREMRERVDRMVGHEAAGLTLGTFHATCARWLRRDGGRLGIEPSFAIYDDQDQIDTIKRTLRELGLDDKQYAPRAVLHEISAAKSELVSPALYRDRADSRFRREVANAYERYNQNLALNQALDFDDLLTRTVHLFEEHPDLLERYQERFRFLMVDEFQDTNMAQYRLARLIAGERGNICVVGDPDQSIYSWRKADIRNILNFEHDYPKLKTIVLGQNYRSTGSILAVAQAVIEPNEQRKQRELWTENARGEAVTLFEAFDEREEAMYVVREQERHLAGGGRRTDVAVLYRTNAQSRAIEDACVRFNVPYRLVGGTRFYERREVKDLLSYLRLIMNPVDLVSLLRVINTPPRGLGAKALDDLDRWARSEGLHPAEALRKLEGLDEEQNEDEPRRLIPISARARQGLVDFSRLLSDLREARERLTPEQLLDTVVQRCGYEGYLKRDGSEQGEERWQNVLELRTKAREYRELDPGEALERFLEDVSLVQDADALTDETDVITLITLHAAKGLEFPVVFVCGLEEGLIPHVRSIDDPFMLEEERRLLYVGATRAMERLYLSYAQRRSGYLGMRQMGSSRFLDAIPARLLNRAPPGSARFGSPSWRQAAREVELDEHEPDEPPAVPARVNRPSARPSFPEPAWLTEQESDERPAERKMTASFQKGERVTHPIFGLGVVVDSTVAGNDEHVTVLFQGQPGSKRLSQSFARLTRVDETD